MEMVDSRGFITYKVEAVGRREGEPFAARDSDAP